MTINSLCYCLRADDVLKKLSCQAMPDLGKIKSAPQPPPSSILRPSSSLKFELTHSSPEHFAKKGFLGHFGAF